MAVDGGLVEFLFLFFLVVVFGYLVDFCVHFLFCRLCWTSHKHPSLERTLRERIERSPIERPTRELNPGPRP